MVANTVGALFNGFHNPFQVVAYKLNAVVVLDFALLIAETVLMFHAHAVFRDAHIGAGGINPLLVLFGAGAQIQAKGQRQCERQCFLFHLTSSLFDKVLSLCLKDKENRDIPVAHIITNFPFCFKPFRSLTAKRAAH